MRGQDPNNKEPECPLGQVPRWDPRGRLSAKGQDTWGLCAVATQGDVSLFGPSNSFVDLFPLANFEAFASLRLDVGQSLRPGLGTDAATAEAHELSSGLRGRI